MNPEENNEPEVYVPIQNNNTTIPTSYFIFGNKKIIFYFILFALLSIFGTCVAIAIPKADPFTRIILCNPFALIYAAACIFIPVGIKVEVDREAKIIYFKLKGIFPNCCFKNWNTSFKFEDIDHFSIIKTRIGCCTKQFSIIINLKRETNRMLLFQGNDSSCGSEYSDSVKRIPSLLNSMVRE